MVLFGKVRKELGFFQFEERSYRSVSVRLRNAGKSREFRSAEEIHQYGFGLVVGSVPRKEESCSGALHDGTEKRIPERPRGIFRSRFPFFRVGAYVCRCGFDAHAQPFAKRFAKCLVAVGFVASETVVEMRRGHAFPSERIDARQKQRDGIASSRERDDEGIVFRNAEVRKKILENFGHSVVFYGFRHWRLARRKFAGEFFTPGGYEGEKFVVGRGFVRDALAAPDAFVNNDVSAVFTNVEIDGFHKRSAIGCPVSGKFRVDVQRRKAERAMVTRGSFRMFPNLFPAMGTEKGVVFHYERHRFREGFSDLFFHKGALLADAFYYRAAGNAEAFFENAHRMHGVVDGDEVFAQVDHGVEHPSFALHIGYAFMVREHSALQEAFYHECYFPYRFVVVVLSEHARSSVVAVVVDDLESAVNFFQYAKFVEDDVSEIFFQREEKRFHAFGDVHRFEFRIGAEKAVGHGLDLKENQIVRRSGIASGEVIRFFADDTEDRERVGDEMHDADVVLLLFDDEGAVVQHVLQEAVAFDVDLHHFRQLEYFDVFF